MAVLKSKYMKKDENYQYNIFINQKALIDFEDEFKVSTKKICYDHYVMLAIIIISMKYENGFFKHKYIEDNRYIFLNNCVFLKQLPKIKSTMVSNKLSVLQDLGYILMDIENKNERYIAVNRMLLNKWIGTNKNTHTKYLKKHDEKSYLELYDYAKRIFSYNIEEVDKVFLCFDIYRYFEGSYDLDNIKKGLLVFISKWKIRV